MRILSLLLAFLIPLIVSAQKNFKPGYVVTLQGDTIKGTIDYKEWSFTPTKIVFKSAGAPDEKEYTVNDISYFEITGNEAYRRGIVEISLSPAKLSDLNTVRDTSSKIDTVFLKILHGGKTVSLLSYADLIKERFYIQETGKQQPVELIFREYLKEGSMALAVEDLYRTQLRNIMYSYSLYTDKLWEQINEASYDERDLERVIIAMNRKENEGTPEEKKSSRLYWFAGIGAQTGNVRFYGNSPLSRRVVDRQSSILPRISAGIDLFANSAVGKLFYRFEAGYQVNKFSTTSDILDNENAVYTLSNSTITLQAMVNYTFYNTDRLKIPFGLGIMQTHMSHSKNQYKKINTSTGQEYSHVEDWLALRTDATTFFARVSAVFTNKLEVSFLYQPYTGLTKTPGWGVRTDNIQLQLNYLFREKR